MKTITTLLAALTLISSAAAQMPHYQPQPAYSQPNYGQHGHGQRGFTQPGAIDYTALGGQWYMTFNGRSDPNPTPAQVDAQGRFMVRSGNITWQGQFRGMTGQGISMAPKRNGRGIDRFPIRLQFDGQCHIHVSMQGAAPIMIHVNHRPGEPCPR
ncbi:MAG: hypothetical protein AAF253_04820 [Pseudomonadota bacterium]